MCAEDHIITTLKTPSKTPNTTHEDASTTHQPQDRITQCRIESKNLATAKTQFDRAKRREAAVAMPETADDADASPSTPAGVLQQVRQQQEAAAAKRQALHEARKAQRGAKRMGKRQKKAAEKANRKQNKEEARLARRAKETLVAAAADGGSDATALLQPLYGGETWIRGVVCRR